MGNMFFESGLTNLIREHYEMTIHKLIEEESEFYNIFSKGTEAYEGNTWRVTLQAERQAGVGARAAGARLPESDTFGVDIMNVGVKRMYAVGMIDKLVRKLNARSQSDRIVDIFKESMENVKNSAIAFTDQAFLFDGTGFRAKNGETWAGTKTAGTALLLQSYFPNDVNASGLRPGGTQYLRKNDRIKFVNASGVDITNGAVKYFTIDKVVQASGTITLKDAVTFVGSHSADAAYIIWGADNYGDSYNNDINGIWHLFSTCAAGLPYFGLDTTKSDYYKALYSTSLPSLSFDLVALEDKLLVPEYYSGKGIDVLISHPIMRTEFAKIIDAKLIYTNFDFNIKKGVKSLSFALGDRLIPWRLYKAMPYNFMFGLTSADWKHYSLSGWEFDTEGGLFKQVPNYDHVYYYMSFYGNLACKRPGSQLAFKVECDTTNLPQ